MMARPSLLQRSGLAAFAALIACPAQSETERLSYAVVETHTCANLSPANNADPAAMQQISRAIALVHNTGVLPAGADRARVVLRLCFNGTIDQPIIEVTDYSGPAGAVAEATQRAAERTVRRALKAGTLTEALGALAGGEPQNAVVDLVFGPLHEAGE